MSNADTNDTLVADSSDDGSSISTTTEAIYLTQAQATAKINDLTAQALAQQDAQFELENQFQEFKEEMEELIRRNEQLLNENTELLIKIEALEAELHGFKGKGEVSEEVEKTSGDEGEKLVDVEMSVEEMAQTSGDEGEKLADVEMSVELDAENEGNVESETEVAGKA